MLVVSTNSFGGGCLQRRGMSVHALYRRYRNLETVCIVMESCWETFREIQFLYEMYSFQLSHGHACANNNRVGVLAGC